MNGVSVCDENQWYVENNIKKIEVTINKINLNLISILQLDQYNGETTLIVKNTRKLDEKILNINNVLYQDFEVIDLR